MAEPDPPRGVEQLAAASADQTKRWQEATEKIRSRTDLTAKALAALGTTGITAAGLSKFSDIFPLPTWDEVTPAHIAAVAAVVLGLVAMAVAVLWLVARLWKVAEPVFASPKLDRMREELGGRPKDGVRPDTDELKRVEEIYDEAAALNEAASLEDYAARGHRQERVAYQLPVDSGAAKLAAAEAAQIRADITATMARATTNVVRMRAHSAVRSGRTALIAAIFVCGLLAFGIGADYLDSERSGRIATAKACAEAVKALREADAKSDPPAAAALLPTVCGGKGSVPSPVPAETPAKSSPAAETRAALAGLMERYTACIDAAKDDARKCTKLRAALDAALP